MNEKMIAYLNTLHPLHAALAGMLLICRTSVWDLISIGIIELITTAVEATRGEKRPSWIDILDPYDSDLDWDLIDLASYDLSVEIAHHDHGEEVTQ